MERNVVMLGPPGAGKGTQAARLARIWGIPHISTGAILRDAVQAGTPLGHQVAATMQSGGLIADALITRVVSDRLARPDAARGFLLDGFPRTVAQGESLDRVCRTRAPLVIVEIVLSDEDVLRRLAARLICSECGINSQDDREFTFCHDCGGRLVPRVDDKAEVVRRRLHVYREQTAPVVDFYRARPTFCRIDGAQFADVVTEAIIEAVDTRV